MIIQEEFLKISSNNKLWVQNITIKLLSKGVLSDSFVLLNQLSLIFSERAGKEKQRGNFIIHYTLTKPSAEM
jgi:hypothetical protein